MKMPLSRLGAEIAGQLDGRRVVVGLSGGMDSVTLLTMLVRAGSDVRAAHVDHQLRESSANDARFCATLAANLGVRFASAQVEIARGNSTQGRARHQRYAALVRLATELGGDVLAVAHHADDAWESAQLQRERGAGAVGAAGPDPWSTWWGFDVVRPLLGVRRADLRSLAQRWRLTWCEDPSNDDPRYARVRLRQSAQEYDAATLASRRDAAQAITDDVRRVVSGPIGPLRRTFGRADLGAHRGALVARVLLDAARALHGELPFPLVVQLVAAVADDTSRPRWFCGRRVAVEVAADTVGVHATRSQGTRLMDARSTPTIDLSTASPQFPWFAHTIVVASTTDRLAVRGPRRGDRLGDRRVHDLLSELRVPPSDRWCWPCLVIDDEVIDVATSAGHLVIEHRDGRGSFAPNG